MPPSNSQRPALSVTKEYSDKFNGLPGKLLKFAADRGVVPEYLSDLREAINKGEPIRDLSAYAEKYQRLSTLQVSGMLTPSEIEQLRQEQNARLDVM